MPSNSLAALLDGVAEVRALREHFVVKRGRIPSGLEADASKAHGRACVVLLSSHYERYFYSLNEEAIEYINNANCPLKDVPTILLLQHSQAVVDELAKTNWNMREDKLRAFAMSETPLWREGKSGTLDHSQLLTWMKAPHPKNIKRFYALYGVPDVFAAVTRSTQSKQRLYLDLTELVEKRNSIAHGDASVEALSMDVTRYLTSVVKFASSADKVMARCIRKISGRASS